MEAWAHIMHASTAAETMEGPANTHAIIFYSSTSFCISGTEELEINFPRFLCS